MNEKPFIVAIGLNTQNEKQRFESTNYGAGVPYKIMEGLYCIKTPYNTTSESLRNRLTSMFFDQCYLFVMKASIEAAWRVRPEVDSWLRDNI